VPNTCCTGGGVENPQWLFLATLPAMLLLNVPFWYLVKTFQRARFIPIAYRFFALNILLFAAALYWADAQQIIWIAAAERRLADDISGASALRRPCESRGPLARCSMPWSRARTVTRPRTSSTPWSSRRRSGRSLVVHILVLARPLRQGDRPCGRDPVGGLAGKWSLARPQARHDGGAGEPVGGRLDQRRTRRRVLDPTSAAMPAFSLGMPHRAAFRTRRAHSPACAPAGRCPEWRRSRPDGRARI